MADSVNALLTELTAMAYNFRQKQEPYMAGLLDRTHETLARYAAGVIGHIGQNQTLQRQLEEMKARAENAEARVNELESQRPEIFR